MKKSENQKKIKLNLTLDEDFYEELEQEASREYMRITNFTKWFLRKHLQETKNKKQTVKQNEYSV